MSQKFINIILASIVLGLSCVSVSYANVGIPMVALQMPLMVALLIPIFIIEAVLLKNYLAISLKSSSLISIKANLSSTFIGSPLSWFLHLLFGGIIGYPLSLLADKYPAILSSDIIRHNEWFFEATGLLLSASWLFPYEDKLYWMLPIAGLIGLIPAYFISVWVEYVFIKKQALTVNLSPVKIMFRINLFSYAFLAGIWSIQLYFNISGGSDAAKEIVTFPFNLF